MFLFILQKKQNKIKRVKKERERAYECMCLLKTTASNLVSKIRWHIRNEKVKANEKEEKERKRKKSNDEMKFLRK